MEWDTLPAIERVLDAIVDAQGAIRLAKDQHVALIPDSGIAAPVMAALADQLLFLEREAERLRARARLLIQSHK